MTTRVPIRVWDNDGPNLVELQALQKKVPSASDPTAYTYTYVENATVTAQVVMDDGAVAISTFSVPNVASSAVGRYATTKSGTLDATVMNRIRYTVVFVDGTPTLTIDEPLTVTR